MTVRQKRKILQRIVELETDISELKRCRKEIAELGYSSATMSSSSGSKSYTRLDLTKISETIAEVTRELKSLRKMLATGNDIEEIPSRKIYTVYF
jgi:Mg2+ and Co2+ transporter CorA